MKTKTITLLAVLITIWVGKVQANKITATPSNYSGYVSGLLPGDTLYLTAGNYTSGLSITNLNGTAAKPIVIMGAGNTTVFLGNACCSTVNIVMSSYIVLKNFKVDGQDIDYIEAVKVSGTAGNYAHHLTIENLLIVRNGGTANDNQTVAISTKGTTWDCIIRGCTIIRAGTGAYLGNSDGSSPFVRGIIENNLFINTKGYNMEIKSQADGERAKFPETSVDNQKTIIRYNVWCKDSGTVTADGARPCLLIGELPSTSYGSNDHYEIYGNFFYNNYSEALIQITGNTALYSNVFVNHKDPSGYRTVLITSQHGFQPRSMWIFHNTILAATTTYGMRLYDPNTSYSQYCYANAVFSYAPVTNLTEVDDVTDTYANAGTYINNPSTTLSSLDLFPKAGKLKGTLTSKTLFTGFTDYDKDFNGTTYDWTYRGAYSGSGVNPGTHLQLAIITTGLATGINENYGTNDFSGMVYPNPANSSFDLTLNLEQNATLKVLLTDLEGQTLKTLYSGMMQIGDNKITSDVNGLSEGFYLVTIQMQDRIITRKLLITK